MNNQAETRADNTNHQLTMFDRMHDGGSEMSLLSEPSPTVLGNQQNDFLAKTTVFSPAPDKENQQKFATKTN